MQITDPIADLLTRIRNASTAKHPSVEIPASNMKKAICQILVDEGYVKSMQVKNDTVQGTIVLNLKYQANGEPGPGRAEAHFQAGPAHLHRLREYAPRHEGPGHRNYFHLQGHHDR